MLTPTQQRDIEERAAELMRQGHSIETALDHARATVLAESRRKGRTPPPYGSLVCLWCGEKPRRNPNDPPKVFYCVCGWRGKLPNVGRWTVFSRKKG